MEYIIPKVIHYCWFGKKPLTELAIKCIDSWKRQLPDYKIIEWNENTFDLSVNRFVSEAYSKGKYAFVADYVRLYAMFNHGGIYMDVDVEVIQKIDEFLSNEAFFGFESKKCISTGIMASIKGFYLIEELLSYYDDKIFINPDGSFNQTTNVNIITNIFLKYGLIRNNQYQLISGFALYPNYYFSPSDKDLKSEKLKNRIYTIHYFEGSWLTEKQKRRLKSPLGKVLIFFASKILLFYTKLFGKERAEIIYRKTKKILKIK